MPIDSWVVTAVLAFWVAAGGACPAFEDEKVSQRQDGHFLPVPWSRRPLSWDLRASEQIQLSRDRSLTRKTSLQVLESCCWIKVLLA